MPNGLKYLRERSGLTQREAADRFGLTLDGYAKIERGERGLGQRHIEKACDAFGADVGEVLGELRDNEQSDGALPLVAIDHRLLTALIAAARERLGTIDEAEARNLVAALIEAARKPLRH